MIVGTLELSLRLEGCSSLKDKRRIVRSLVDHLHRDFKAAASEVADHDLWSNATLGIALVGTAPGSVESTLQKIVDYVDSDPRVSIDGMLREITRT